MRSQIGALAWEELRVGGSIAAVVAACGVAVQFAIFRAMGPYAVQQDASIALLILGAPLFIALLLTLNIDNSGHVTAGFSKRLLRLPVPASSLAGVVLTVRTGVLAATSLLCLTTARLMFDPVPGFQAVGIILAVYFLVQTIDSLRVPISGLTTLVTIAVVAGCVWLALRYDDLFATALTRMDELPTASILWVVAMIVLFCAAYAVNLPAVHAARIGKRVGIPELWEWPRYLTAPSVSRRPFASPVAAQVWFEFRQSGWILPVGTLAITLLATAGAWATTWATTRISFQDEFIFATLLGIAPYIGIIFAAIAQGATRPSSAYVLARPISDLDLARARLVSNALSVIPTVLIAMALQVSVQNREYYTEIVSYALASDLISYRELAWILLSRGLLIGILAWALVAAPGRFGSATAIGAVAIVVIVALLNTAFGRPDFEPLLGPWLFFLLVTLVMYVWQWRRGLLSTGTLIRWGFVWLLAAWLVYGAGRPTLTFVGVDGWQRISIVVASLGLASFLVLPLVAIVADTNVNRHGRFVTQGQNQHSGRAPTGAVRRYIPYAVVGICAGFAIWLGSPAEPGYFEVWRDRGWPVSLKELDRWYVQVPPGENAATAYLAIAKRHESRDAALADELDANLPSTGSFEEIEYNLAKVDNRAAIPPYSEPISADSWNSFRTYRDRVARETTEELLALSPELNEARYPLNLTAGDLRIDYRRHVLRLRGLTRALRVEAFYQSLQDNPDESSEAVLAAIRVADSLAGAPTTMAQSTRFGILGSVAYSIQECMNVTLFEGDDLERMQTSLSASMDAAVDELESNRPRVGDFVSTMTRNHELALFEFNESGAKSELRTPMPFFALIMPPAAMNVTSAVVFDVTREREPWREDRQPYESDLADAYLGASRSLVPLLWVSWDWIYYTAAVNEMEVALAKTALAVERYRLEHQRLPAGLEALVPDFLDSVPVDYFSGGTAPLKYRPTKDGGFIVYTVYQNMIDEGGTDDGDLSERDLVFKVLPLEYRLGPHIPDSENE